jgi:hypothetical protein
MSFLTRRRSIDTIADFEPGTRLTPTLSWPHLIALGVGAIVGTGIYTLIRGRGKSERWDGMEEYMHIADLYIV